MFGWQDGLLMVVVVVQVLLLTYARTPRWKSMLYMLPLPFSFALLATGRAVDATHVTGFLQVWAMLWGVMHLHLRYRVPILLADAIGVACYALLGVAMARLIPKAGSPDEPILFWAALTIMLGVGVLSLFRRHGIEPGHRTQLPAWIKVPIVMCIVALLILAKSHMRGFMVTFPLVTMFVLYEARFCLRTLLYRFPIFVVSAVPMLLLLRFALPQGEVVGPGRMSLAIVAAWVVFVPLFLAVERWYVRAHD